MNRASGEQNCAERRTTENRKHELGGLQLAGETFSRALDHLYL